MNQRTVGIRVKFECATRVKWKLVPKLAEHIAEQSLKVWI